MEPSGGKKKIKLQKKIWIGLQSCYKQTLAKGLTWSRCFFKCKYLRHLTMHEADLKCFPLLQTFSPQIPFPKCSCLSGGSWFSGSSLLFLEISDARAGNRGTAPEDQPCLLFTFALVVVHKAQGGKSPSPAPILHTLPDVKLINTASNYNHVDRAALLGLTTQ